MSRGGRLSEEFRARTKRFAATAIRLYVKLPKTKEEGTKPLEQEADELMAIFISMIRKTGSD